MMAGKFGDLNSLCSKLESVMSTCQQVQDNLVTPLPSIRSMERGEFLAHLTLLQFRHPQYARLFEEIKMMLPGSVGLDLPQSVTSDLRFLMRDIVPAEVSFVEISKKCPIESRTRLSSTEPEFPLPGIDIGFYRIIIETLSETDKIIVPEKARAHSASPDSSLILSLKLLRLGQVTSGIHRPSRFSLNISSLFKHQRSQSG